MASPAPKGTRSWFSPENITVGLAVILLLLPWLFVSSPAKREITLAVFGVVTVLLGCFMTEVKRVAGDRLFLATAGCMVLVYLASLAGGLRQDETIPQALSYLFLGISGVAGMGILTLVLLQQRWHAVALWTFFILTTTLVVSSLLGFFVFTEWQVELSKKTPHLDPRRLALIWPSRMIVGNQFWVHTNTAAFLFATAWVVTVDMLSRRPRFAAGGWVLTVLLGTAVFLTASRSAWLMIILALPVLLAFRSWKFSLRVGGSLAVCLVLGLLGMKHAVDEAVKPVPEGGLGVVQENPGAIHVSGLVERGSSGRIEYYKNLWANLEGDRLFGHGHAVARTPFGILLHEHSSYLATMRSGGLVALMGHLMIVGLALFAGFSLARQGCRWPLLLGIAVFSGLLFDRSTVFRLTGTTEFPLHWFAVWIPMVLSARYRSRTIDPGGHFQPSHLWERTASSTFPKPECGSRLRSFTRMCSSSRTGR